MAAYALAEASLHRLLQEDPQADPTKLRDQLYAACGRPLGTSPAARWVWHHFGQWVTVN